MKDVLKEENGRTLALCDTEEEYAQLMTELLRKNRELPWEIHTYTDAQEMLKQEKSAAMVVVSESAYCEALQSVCPGRLVVLSESGVVRWENIFYVDKYQRAEDVLTQLLAIYVEFADTPLPRLGKKCSAVLIGNYTPIHRSMQTSFALTMSQLLAREHSVLYLNFEHYAGISELLLDMQTLDLADLLYFLGAEKEKFRLRMRTMLKRIGNLDYIPPMKSGQNLLTVPAAEWLGLLRKIDELGEYEYVILDLSESMQGLFDILRQCRQIYTLTQENRVARSKLLQYEQILALYEYDDVLEKTKCLKLPHIRKVPEELEQLTKGELAGLVRDLLKEL